MNYIVATVLSNSADDAHGRVIVSSIGLWDKSELIPSVGNCILAPDDLVLVDISMGKEYPVILGKYKGAAQSKVSPSGEGEIVWESRYGKDWTQLRSKGNKTILKNSSGVEIVINKNKVTIKSNLIEIDSAITVNKSAGPPEIKGPFCALPNCLFTGTPHVSTKAI